MHRKVNTNLRLYSNENINIFSFTFSLVLCNFSADFVYCMDLKLFWEITNMQGKKETCKCPFCICPRGDWLHGYPGATKDSQPPPDLKRTSFIQCLLGSLNPDTFVPCTLHMYMRIANHFMELLFFSCLDAAAWKKQLQQTMYNRKIPFPTVSICSPLFLPDVILILNI
jgi:hypothetical protein